ncbi:MAG TPA: hypothetical protein PLE19_22110 [Planctomycetota bacterium]|nr:hypothetical protein [Planctomycetota bacterium]HRR82402.1 hypothetical protein [Planctomycetota bacterium]HRT97782.1 hypothetical protein [Planctomycetota bacterium]
MQRVAVASRAAALLVAAGAAAGCTSLAERSRNPLHFVGLYLQDRAQDLLEVADVGVTVSPEPCFAIYGAFASLTPAGVAYVDGRFFGLGGGQFFGLGAGTWGSTPFYLAAAGMLVWGYEELGWQQFDLKDMSTVHCQDVGLAGLFIAPQGRPGPVPS